MSSKRRIESLASLGELTAKDVKAIQSGADARRDKGRAVLGLCTIIAVLALASLSQSAYIWWWILHR